MALRAAPGPPKRAFLGSLPDFRADPIAFLADLRHQYGDVVRFHLGPRLAHLITHPGEIRHVLQTNSRNYGKQTPGILRLRGILGDGLLTSDGESWLLHRRIAQLAFHRDRIASFATTMTHAAGEMLTMWGRQEKLDVAAEMMRVTLRIVSETLFSTDVSPAANEVGVALSTAVHITHRRLTRAFNLPGFVPSPENLRFKAAIRVLDRVVLPMIRARRVGTSQAQDLLWMLTHARDAETGEMMSDRQLRDEVMTVFLAGHETTANALTWTLYLLSQSPEAEARLHQELADVLGPRTPTEGDAAQLRYTTMVLEEALRLYPPGWLFARSPHADDQLGGYLIPAGSIVFMSPYLTHRHPEFWPDAEQFRPERFAPAATEARDRFAFFPFSGGPRQCIGASFAMLEMQLLLAMVAQRYRLRLEPGFPVTTQPVVTLRPRHGMRMVLDRR